MQGSVKAGWPGNERGVMIFVPQAMTMIEPCNEAVGRAATLILSTLGDNSMNIQGVQYDSFFIYTIGSGCGHRNALCAAYLLLPVPKRHWHRSLTLWHSSHIICMSTCTGVVQVIFAELQGGSLWKCVSPGGLQCNRTSAQGVLGMRLRPP